MAKGQKKAKKQKGAPPPQGDIGQQTDAQMVNQRIADIVEKNGAKFQRRIRDNHIAKMAMPNGSRGAMITPRQAVAGMIYQDAALKTELSGEVTWARVLVDCTSRHGDINPAKLDAVTEVKRIEAIIPRDVRQVVRRICCWEDSVSRIARGDNRRIGKVKGQLRRGLGVLARDLGLGCD